MVGLVFLSFLTISGLYASAMTRPAVLALVWGFLTAVVSIKTPHPFHVFVSSPIFAARVRLLVTFSGMDEIPGSTSVSNRMMNGELNPSCDSSTRRITPPHTSTPAATRSLPFSSLPLFRGLYTVLLTDAITFGFLFLGWLLGFNDDESILIVDF